MRLKIKGLYTELQDQEILHDINLDIASGAFISLLGSSGCGKTTLLKSIAGLLPLKQGEIWLDDRQIQNEPPQKRGTVIVFQDLRLFPHMSVEKNISFSLDIKRADKSRKHKIVEQLLEEVQLAGYEKRKIRELSGGQKQRVALARALAAEPEILLLDEPFSGPDEELRQEMGRLVRELQQEKKITTILVTHDRQEADRMSDRIVYMEEGRITRYEEHNF